MLDLNEAGSIADAANQLELEPRTARWGHLSLCLIDATFSINAHYDTHVVPTVRRYAESVGLATVLVKGEALNEPLSPRPDEQSLSDFLQTISLLSDAELANEVFKNRQLTSTTGGILKAGAVRRIASILQEHGIERLDDVKTLLADHDKTADVEKSLAAVPGHGLHGVRTGYIWMTAGDDHTVKPDRHILSWLQAVLGRTVGVAESRNLLSDASEKLGVTPWVLDHAIWRHKALKR